jgi:hypothetical protein
VNAHDLASGVAPTRLFGFDEDGEVFDLGDLILRRIRESRKADVAAVHRTYERARLAAKGIVETRLRSDGDLEHRKLVVSYPYEWPANMYKDAVLFHLRLIAALDSDGLTLKDALPNNILFDHTRPVFVDFLSLVPRERLAEAAWLGAGSHADPRFVVARKMLLPYMILPLLFMARGAYRIARDLLSWRSCNCEGEPPSWLELLAAHGRPSRTWLRRYLRSLRIAAELLPARYWTRRRKPDAFDSLLTRLLEQVRSLDVTPPLSAYSYYYDEKKEEISFDSPGEFPPKQRAVHGLLRAKAPRTVLDLGANTGWYSVLAAREGASVIAGDTRRACARRHPALSGGRRAPPRRSRARARPAASSGPRRGPVDRGRFRDAEQARRANPRRRIRLAGRREDPRRPCLLPQPAALRCRDLQPRPRARGRTTAFCQSRGAAVPPRLADPAGVRPMRVAPTVKRTGNDGSPWQRC